MVLLTWYNNLVLLKDGSVESSLTIVEPPVGRVASLNPDDGLEGLLSDKRLVEPLGRGNI